MSIANLKSLFAPQSVALIGASRKANSVGAVLAQNLAGGGFAGEFWPVNPNARELGGRTVYRSIAALPATPELAVIATPPQTIPGIVGELAKRGTKAVVVITAGFSESRDEEGKRRTQAMLDAALTWPGGSGGTASPRGLGGWLQRLLGRGN